MSISLFSQGKFAEKYFKKFHLPNFQFQVLDGRICPSYLSLTYDTQDAQTFKFPPGGQT